MPFLLKVAQTTETELPPVQMYGWLSYAHAREQGRVQGAAADPREGRADQAAARRTTRSRSRRPSSATRASSAGSASSRTRTRSSCARRPTCWRATAAATTRRSRRWSSCSAHSDLEVRNEALTRGRRHRGQRQRAGGQADRRARGRRGRPLDLEQLQARGPADALAPAEPRRRQLLSARAGCAHSRAVRERARVLAPGPGVS